jgi:hypothetical protein
MATTIVYTPIFVKKAKDLKKKHISLTKDIEELEKELILNPKQGVDLGGGLHKIRLAVKSKGKGKSGGYRIITYLVNQSANDVNVTMLTLYAKSEEETMNKQFLLNLLKEF